MALARSEKSPQRFYSMSAQIRQERKAYYEILEDTQRGDLDITPWLDWFLTVSAAPSTGPSDPGGRAQKARFWEQFVAVKLNERQREIINRLLNGFEGKLTSSKWAKLRQMFAGYGPARHRGPHPKGSADERHSGRPKHILFACKDHMKGAALKMTVWNGGAGHVTIRAELTELRCCLVS